MGSRRMSSLKITLHLLALCLLLSITTKDSGKPNPRHLLIETEEQAKKTADYKEPGTDYNKAEDNDDYQNVNLNFGTQHGVNQNGGNSGFGNGGFGGFGLDSFGLGRRWG